MRPAVLAFHGCDISVRDGLVRGDLVPTPSKNEYDWLGEGMYFFEGDSDRALKLATMASTHPERQLTKRPIVRAAVVGAVLEVDRWLDLTTQEGISNFADTAEMLLKSGGKVPVNRPAYEGDEDNLHRAFDCAVFTLIHAFQKADHLEALKIANAAEIIRTAPYQATRAPFEQGKRIASSALYSDTHIQVAVRDVSCIRGWFLLPRDQLLSDANYLAAQEAMVAAGAAKTAGKPRKRAAAKH